MQPRGPSPSPSSSSSCPVPPSPSSIASLHRLSNLLPSHLHTQSLSKSHPQPPSTPSKRAANNHYTAQSHGQFTFDQSGALYGSIANIYWGAIPMDDLRAHPHYTALPDPSDIIISTYQDLCLFRQDTWQWDALHQGRLTTSKLASLLGFYEQETATYLRIPNSLRGHERAVASWQHLRQKPPDSWLHLQTGSAIKSTCGDDATSLWIASENTHQQVIGDKTGRLGHDISRFPYHYNPQDEKWSKRIRSEGLRDVRQIRLAWGSTQEATALLAVLNHLSRTRANARLMESGMCVFEALDGESPSRASLDIIRRWIAEDKSLPLLGASPDGLIRHSDGSLTVLEVKCFSPFINASGPEAGGKTLAVLMRHESHDAVPVWHIPQLQLEMLCTGSNCRSAWLMILYVDRAVIYEILRDDNVSPPYLKLSI
jgi:hypothetical protein